MPALSAWLDANGLLRIMLTSWPSPQEVNEFRQRLRRSGMLRDHLVVLADLRKLSSESEPAWEELHTVLRQIPLDYVGPRRYALLTNRISSHWRG